MRIKYKDLRGFVRRVLAEAGDEPSGKPEKGKKEKKEKQECNSPFSCPRHGQSLCPSWRKVQVKVGGDQSTEFQPYGPLKPGKSRYQVPPTSEMIPTAGETETKSIISHYVCPLWEEPGSYGRSKKYPDGHACDFRVTARIMGPGQKYKHVALGEVAEEEGMLFEPIKPRQTAKQAPDAFVSMIEMMAAQKFNWKKVQAEKGGPIEWKKVPAAGEKRFTSDDVTFLSYFYPKMLGDAKRKAGDEYEGPEPYFFSSDRVFRDLRARGWEIADPATKERRVTRSLGAEEPSSLPSSKSVLKRPGSTSTAGAGSVDVPWYDDDDDPWDEDTDVDSDDSDDDDIPDRWR